MPIVFAQPEPVGAANFLAGYAGGGGGGGHQNPFPPTIPAPQVFVQPVMPGGHEDPVDAQLRLDEGRLSMAEELRLQRLQGGLADVDEYEQNGTLTAEQARDLKMQIKTGIHPYQLRQAQAAVQAQEAQTTVLQNRAALLRSIQNGDMEAVARSLQNRTVEYRDPNIEAQARQEYDTNQDVANWNPDEEDLQPWLTHREQAIRARVAELGGLQRMFVQDDGQVLPYAQPGRGAGTGTAGTAGGEGTTRGRAMATEMDPTHVFAERRHIETDVRKEFEKEDHDANFDPTPYLEFTSPADREVLARVLPNVEALMQFPDDIRIKKLRQAMKDSPAFRSFIQRRVVEDRLESALGHMGLDRTGRRLETSQQQPWWNRGAPNQGLSPAQPIPEAAMGPMTIRANMQARTDLPQPQQVVLAELDQIGGNIARVPQAQQQALRAKLARARTLFQQYGDTDAMPPTLRAEFNQLSADLNPYAVANRSAEPDMSQPGWAERRPGEDTSQHLRRIRRTMGLAPTESIEAEAGWTPEDIRREFGFLQQE